MWYLTFIGAALGITTGCVLQRMAGPCLHSGRKAIPVLASVLMPSPPHSPSIKLLRASGTRCFYSMAPMLHAWEGKTWPYIVPRPPSQPCLTPQGQPALTCGRYLGPPLLLLFLPASLPGIIPFPPFYLLHGFRMFQQWIQSPISLFPV